MLEAKFGGDSLLAIFPALYGSFIKVLLCYKREVLVVLKLFLSKPNERKVARLRRNYDNDFFLIF